MGAFCCTLTSMNDADLTTYVTTVLDQRFTADDETLLAWTVTFVEFAGAPTGHLTMTETERSWPAEPLQAKLADRYSHLRETLFTDWA